MRIKLSPKSIAVAPLLIASFFAHAASAQDDEDPAYRQRIVKQAEPVPMGMYLIGGSGVAIFQDIQVPVNEMSETRGDGMIIAEENQDHMGIPLFAGLGYRKRSGSLMYDLAGVEGTRISAMTGPSATQSSSYSRLELFSGVTYNFKLAGSDLNLGLRGSIRRTLFSNVSAAHFVESALVRAHAGWTSGSLSLNAFLGYAPYSRVGYTASGITGGDYFKKASTSVSEAGLSASFSVNATAFLDLGLEQESINLKLNDIMEYNGFGLNVTPGRQRVREYNLSTAMFKAGFRKLF